MTPFEIDWANRERWQRTLSDADRIRLAHLPTPEYEQLYQQWAQQQESQAWKDTAARQQAIYNQSLIDTANREKAKQAEAEAEFARKRDHNMKRRDEWDQLNKQGKYDPDGWQSIGEQPDPIAIPDWWLESTAGALPAAPAAPAANALGTTVPGAVNRPDSPPPPPHIQELLDLHGPAARIAPLEAQGEAGRPAPALPGVPPAAPPAPPAMNTLLQAPGGQAQPRSWTQGGQAQAQANGWAAPQGQQPAQGTSAPQSWTARPQRPQRPQPSGWQTPGPSKWGTGGQAATPGQRRMGY